LLLANKYCNPLASVVKKSTLRRFIPSITASASSLADMPAMYHFACDVPNMATQLSNRGLDFPLSGNWSFHQAAASASHHAADAES
jgi:hypothetical protein